MRELVPEVLVSKIEFGPGCWLWLGRLTKDGYGIGPLGLVHRAVWVATHGLKIPAGLECHHECYVQKCCNPGHIRLMTPLENREHAKARRLALFSGYCKRGHPKEYGVDCVPCRRERNRGWRARAMERAWRKKHRGAFLLKRLRDLRAGRPLDS